MPLCGSQKEKTSIRILLQVQIACVVKIETAAHFWHDYQQSGLARKDHVDGVYCKLKKKKIANSVKRHICDVKTS